MFPGDKSTPSKVHFPFEWCKIYKEHMLAGCLRLTATSAADSRPVLEGMADGMKCSVVREGVGLELLLLLQNERLQMRWPGHWVRTSPRCPPSHVLFLARPTKKNDDTPKGPRMDAWMDDYPLVIKTKNNPPSTQFKSVNLNLTNATHMSFATLRKSVWNFCSSTACWVDLKRRWSDEQETPVPSLKTLLVISRRRTTESFQMHRRCWTENSQVGTGAFFVSLISYFKTVQALKDNLHLAVVAKLTVKKKQQCVFSSVLKSFTTNQHHSISVLFKSSSGVFFGAAEVNRVTISFLIFLQWQSLIVLRASPCKRAKRTQVAFAFGDVIHGLINVVEYVGVTPRHQYSQSTFSFEWLVTELWSSNVHICLLVFFSPKILTDFRKQN